MTEWLKVFWFSLGMAAGVGFVLAMAFLEIVINRNRK